LNYQGHQQATAAYLLEGPAGPILIETGPASTLDNLLAALAERGYQPADIRHLIVTHIHLDHAGAAGWWAQQGTQVYVHHVGAPHLVDPSRLLASAGRIYGDQMEKLWGQVLPAPAQQVTALVDGDQLRLAGLTLTALDTPGHAWHHHTIRVEDIAFTGDAAGVRLPATTWVSVPAPPPEFKLEIWLQTVDRLEAQGFKALYLTHFGPLDGADAVKEHFARLRRQLRLTTEFVRAELEQGSDRDVIVARYQQWNAEQARLGGVSRDAYLSHSAANPEYMSVDGIIRYWRRRWKTETP